MCACGGVETACSATAGELFARYHSERVHASLHGWHRHTRWSHVIFFRSPTLSLHVCFPSTYPGRPCPLPSPNHCSVRAWSMCLECVVSTCRLSNSSTPPHGDNSGGEHVSFLSSLEWVAIIRRITDTSPNSWRPSVLCCAGKTWNSLTWDVKSSATLSTFKLQLKTYFLLSFPGM